jgi:hypothetical protein
LELYVVKTVSLVLEPLKLKQHSFSIAILYIFCMLFFTPMKEYITVNTLGMAVPFVEQNRSMPPTDIVARLLVLPMIDLSTGAAGNITVFVRVPPADIDRKNIPGVLLQTFDGYLPRRFPFFFERC